MLRAVKTAAEKQHAAARIVVLSMFPEYMRHSLVDAVVPVVEHDVAGDERRVDGVGDQHVYRCFKYVAPEHCRFPLCDRRPPPDAGGAAVFFILSHVSHGKWLRNPRQTKKFAT